MAELCLCAAAPHGVRCKNNSLIQSGIVALYGFHVKGRHFLNWRLRITLDVVFFVRHKSILLSVMCKIHCIKSITQAYVFFYAPFREKAKHDLSIKIQIFFGEVLVFLLK